MIGIAPGLHGGKGRHDEQAAGNREAAQIHGRAKAERR